MKRAYYNEYDPYKAQWLRNLIAEGAIAPGDVDTRSIEDVDPDDLRGYAQCHFFAGIGGWSLAARLVGWPDDKPLWTGSAPCQPWSDAGEQRGFDDERHLWPHQFRLIRACRPPVWMGEQVASSVGKGWLDGVLADLESIAYAGRSVVVPACAVNKAHKRDRLWIASGRGDVGHGVGARLEGHPRDVDHAGEGALANRPAPSPGFRSDESWIVGHDGRVRRIEPGVSLLAYGVPPFVGALHAFGDAIVPQIAAEVLGAWLDMERSGDRSAHWLIDPELDALIG